MTIEVFFSRIKRIVSPDGEMGKHEGLECKNLSA